MNLLVFCDFVHVWYPQIFGKYLKITVILRKRISGWINTFIFDIVFVFFPTFSYSIHQSIKCNHYLHQSKNQKRNQEIMLSLQGMLLISKIKQKRIQNRGFYADFVLVVSMIWFDLTWIHFQRKQTKLKQKIEATNKTKQNPSLNWCLFVCVCQFLFFTASFHCLFWFCFYFSDLNPWKNYVD